MIYADTGYVVDQVFWQHVGLLRDRLDAQDFAATAYSIEDRPEAELHQRLATLASDYEKLTQLGAELRGVARLGAELRGVADQKAGLEERWLTVAATLES